MGEYISRASRSSYYTGDERVPSRLWAAEKFLHDMKEVGLIDFFEGPGPNPTLHTGYDSGKVWLQQMPGVQPQQGTFRLWNGNSPESELANWLPITPSRFFELVTGGVTSTIYPIATQPEAEGGVTPNVLMDSVRAKQAIITRIVTPEDYGSLQSAIDADRNVEGRPGASYTHTGVTLSNSDSFDGKNAIVTAGVGAVMYTLRDYAPVLERLYISDSRPSIDYAIRIDTSRFAKVRDIVIANAGAGGIKLVPTTGSVSLTELVGLNFEGITGTGVLIGSSVNEIRGTNLYIHGKLDFDGDGKGRPQLGTIGWRQNTPVIGGLAVGGHQIVSAIMIDFDIGWWITDAQLSSYTGIIADDTRGYGIIVDGDSRILTFCNVYVGTSMGIKVAGTSQAIKFDCLETRFIGLIPPWGQNPFFNSAGPFYAVTVQDTAKVIINGDNWSGDKRVSVAPTASLTVTGGYWIQGRNTSNIAPGATVYVAEKEYSTASDAVFRAPFTGYLFFGKAVATAAPGAGESVTFTAQINGVDTALSFAIGGASTFDNKMYGPVFVTKDQSITLKVVKSAGAVSGGRYNFDVQILGE